jgi:phospholysine phosphohistidine inorganic pyrophosphate phosphatase
VHWVPGVEGVLVDLDGTLVVQGTEAVPGAAAFLARLRRRNLPFRICSNNTRRSRSMICYQLERADFEINAEDVLIPASLARRSIVESGALRAMLLVPELSLPDFHGVVPDDNHPDWVVLGDLGSGFNHERLSAAFRAIRAGARFVALHRNPFWVEDVTREDVLDVGAYAAALQYATGVAPVVVGKPEAPFFRLAVDELGLDPHQVLMIGDSVANDVAGAAAIGCKTCLIRGTAFREEALRSSRYRPDLIVGSVADLVP